MSTTFTRNLQLLILAFSFKVLCVAAMASVEETSVDASALLRAGNYKQLNEYYTGVQGEFEAGKISGDQLRNVFRAFYPTDRDLAAKYDGWVNAYPKSYVARLARGIYYKKIGLEERGERYISETSQSQIDKMGEAMGRAARDLGASIEMDPKPFLSYFHTMDIGKQYIGNQQLRKLFDEAVELDPNSFGLRQKFMSALEPKWGGSTVAMRSFLEESKQAKLSASNLGELESMVYEAEGDEYHASGHLSAAETAYRKALALGPCSCGNVRNGLNKVLFETGQFKAAIELLDQYLKATPHDLWALPNRGMAELYLGRTQDAINDLHEAAEAGDSYSQDHLGLVYLTGAGDLKPDYPKSVYWLRKAAEQREPEALANLPRAEALANQNP